ncbi:hypothetical protein CRG98_020969, partial [Punica granatum]
MASVSLGTHVPLSRRYRGLSPPIPPNHPRPSVSIPSQSLLADSSVCRFSASRSLRGSILARAEDKAKGSSSPPVQPQDIAPQPNSEERLKDLTTNGACDPLCSLDEVSPEEFEATYQPKTDFLKALAIFAAALTGTAAINHSWVAANQ